MPDLTIWFSRADFVKMGEFLAEEGSNFGKFWKNIGRILENLGKQIGRFFGSAAERSSFKFVKLFWLKSV